MCHKWVELCLCQENVPHEAILVGRDQDGCSNYIGRVRYENQLLLAKVIPKKQKAIFYVNNKEIKKCSVEVLCGDFYEKEEKLNSNEPHSHKFFKFGFSKLFEVSISLNYRWEFAHDGFVPNKAVIGGHTEDKELIYIGRVQHKNSLILGSIIKSKSSLITFYKGKELLFKSYEVLVEK